MKYKSFEIEKYKGIDKTTNVPSIIIKVQENKATALIGINECGKSTILKAICSFDYRNDSKDVHYKHLQTLKNRNKAGASMESAILMADFETQSIDITWLLNYFNTKNLFLKNLVEETTEINGEMQRISYEADKTDEEKISILQKLFKNFRIKCELSKSADTLERKYSVIINEKAVECFNSNINNEAFLTYELDICKSIINLMPNMLYITDLPDFYRENNFAIQEDNRHEECKSLINNLFISATNKSMTIQQFFDLYKTDKAEYSSTRSQVESYLTKEFSDRWNQFGLNNAFGELDIELDAHPDSRIINIQVKEKGQSGNNYYHIDERSMGFQWFFKFVMNISFNPLKDKGIIFLIDEPGTYLHETAQTILSKELNSMLHGNYMVFSTHYYSMLNLKEIELNRIYVVERNQKSIIATKATDYQGYSDEDKKSPILPILNAFRKTVIDFIKSNEAQKILIVEGLYDKYALNVFCKSPKWLNVEIFPSVGASQIADNISEFAYYKNDILALFDNDEPGVKAYNTIKTKNNAIVLDVQEGFKEDPSKSIVMDNLFDINELANLSTKLSSDGLENFATYKDILRILYENKELVEKYKTLIPHTLENFRKLEESILLKLKLIKKNN